MKEAEARLKHGVALLAEGVDRNLRVDADADAPHASPSSRRAWIEIGNPLPKRGPALVALLAEGVDRNFYLLHPAGATAVALLAEGVDRNNFCLMAEITEPTVALLAEGVDRNTHESALRWADVVALLAEGVDRN